jgi:hypothetical protein
MIQRYSPHKITFNSILGVRRVVGDGGTGKTTFVKVFWLSSHLPYALDQALILLPFCSAT